MALPDEDLENLCRLSNRYNILLLVNKILSELVVGFFKYIFTNFRYIPSARGKVMKNSENTDLRWAIRGNLPEWNK